MDDIENRYGGWFDPDLSPEGIKQAEKVADKLTNNNFTAEIILSSPLKRAVQTANIIGKHLNIPVETFVYLKERNTYGLLCGEVETEAKERYPELVSAYEKSEEIPGFESYDFFTRRVHILFEKLGELPHNTIICVTHGKMFAAIFKEILAKPAKDFSKSCLAEIEIDGKNANLVSSDGISFA